MKQQAPERKDIPDKVYFRIGEVSDLVGVDTHVLRFWESEFKEIKPRRAKSNQRLYRKKDVEYLLVIKALLHGEGYTISGARKLLKKHDREQLLADHAESEGKKSPKEHLASIKTELKKIQQILAMRSLRY